MLFFAFLLLFLALILWLIWPAGLRVIMVIIDIAIILLIVFGIKKLFQVLGGKDGLKILIRIVLAIIGFVILVVLPFILPYFARGLLGR